MQQKIFHKWYLTPSRISKIYHNSSPDCWRLCGESGTLFHILWNCPKIKPLWRQIENIIRNFSYQTPPLSPSMAILSIDLESIPNQVRTIISHILLVTRLTILRHWKDTEPPSITEVITTVHNYGTYEVLHASAMGNHEKISKIWEPWNTWYSRRLNYWK